MKERLKIHAGAEGSAFFVDGSVRQQGSHRHDELEVNLVLAGKASYLFGNRRVPLLAGSMIWLFPQQEHVLMDWSSGFSMWVAVFRPGLVERHAATGARGVLRTPDPGEVFCRQVEPRQVNLLHQVYQSAARDDADWEFVNAALGYALVASWQAYHFARDSVLRTDLHPAVAKAARLLSTSDEALPLPVLARESGLSASRLSRLFQRQTGVSLTAFRQRKSLERFLRLYQEGARHTLIEAALLAGFGSYPQFYRVFRQMMHMTPAAYRRKVARGIETSR